MIGGGSLRCPVKPGMTEAIRPLLEEERNEFAQVDAPVAPDVAAVGFHEGVGVLVVVEFLHEVAVGLDQEVGAAAADPEELRFLGEVGRQFLVEVLVHRADVRVGDADGGGEHAGPAEEVRVVDGVVQRVETTHREAADCAGIFLGDSPVVAVDELHDLGERGFEGAFHGLGQLHRRTGTLARPIQALECCLSKAAVDYEIIFDFFLSGA